MSSRRDVLRALAAIGAATMLPFDSRQARAGSGKHRLKTIGLQLYTIRDVMKDDVEGTLRRVAAIGYREVEFAGHHGKEPGEIRRILDSLTLTAPAAHCSVTDLEERWSSTVQNAHSLGHRYLVVASLPLGKEARLDDYRGYASRLNTLGRQCKKEHLTLGYHNHEAEFRPIGELLPYDVLLEETDPELVTMELDLYWIVKAGCDPFAYFSKHKDRFSLLHVKDMEKGPRGDSTDVGSGSIDFASMFRASYPAVKHYFVEQEHFAANPLASVETSWKYLNSLEF